MFGAVKAMDWSGKGIVELAEVSYFRRIREISFVAIQQISLQVHFFNQSAQQAGLVDFGEPLVHRIRTNIEPQWYRDSDRTSDNRVSD